MFMYLNKRSTAKFFHRVIWPLSISLIFSVSLGRAETISFAFNSEWAPFSQGTYDRVTGILPTLIKAVLKDRMGTDVRFVGLALGTGPENGQDGRN